jgi:tetratricopeptide (TPR) repeat protein
VRERLQIPFRIQTPAVVALLLFATYANAQVKPNRDLQAEFRSAVADYDAGKYPQAAAKLERLLPEAPESFEIQEFLGLAYSSQSQNAKALPHLEIAVRIKPGSAEARTNLAACLTHAGKLDQAGDQFRKALALEPQNYDANHNLAEFYLQNNKMAEALPLLEQAQKVNPTSYDNGYDLALADYLTGHLQEARQLIQSLLTVRNTGELHNLLGQVEEKDGQYVAAVNEFQTASHMDPTEDNLFAWASEMLLHRTYDPAIEVFREAVRRYPDSARLRIGLGMALDLVGKYDDAVQALLTAADLAPTDSRCYLYLSKAYNNSPKEAEDVIQRFRHYAELQPNNPMAQYYYAVGLWKGKRLEEAGVDFKLIESLLRKVIALDSKFPDAYVQLGSLYADQHDYARSVPELTKALALDPNLPDAHYRLGQDYVHLGQKDLAQEEFDIYQRQRQEHLAAVDKERAEVQQFVYEARSGASAKP